MLTSDDFEYRLNRYSPKALNFNIKNPLAWFCKANLFPKFFLHDPSKNKLVMAMGSELSLNYTDLKHLLNLSSYKFCFKEKIN